MRLVITGGGTGGHLAIARALGLECAKAGIYTLYIGSTRGQDRQWFDVNFTQDSKSLDSKKTTQNTPFNECVFLESTPVVNQAFLGKFKSLFHNLSEAKKAAQIMKEKKINACISVGGFSAAAASFAAIFTKTPFFIHEQNACMGSLNKLLKPFALRFFSSFPFPNATFTPYPVSEVFFKSARVRSKIHTILFLGGSQGARAINDFALKLAPLLREKNIKILHQSGKLEYEKVLQSYKSLGFKVCNLDSIKTQKSSKNPNLDSKDSNIESSKNTNFLNESIESKSQDSKNIESNLQNSQEDSKETTESITLDSKNLQNYDICLFDFCDIMPQVMNMADFAISRAGASSLFELASNGLPTLFIPYPFAAKNHQFFNAKILSDKNLALLIPQDALNTQDVQQILSQILSLNIESISQNLIENSQPNGTKIIIQNIINLNKKLN
ncbi:glycosyltransferase [Helicobacter saguini]|uniref:glycosyltransferase n=1 Tax=Helicobacter saguini TaxID=1548018 RepID=UPI00054EB351|nr:glycosyltransferase [Helicobacter saguini]